MRFSNVISNSIIAPIITICSICLLLQLLSSCNPVKQKTLTLYQTKTQEIPQEWKEEPIIIIDHNQKLDLKLKKENNKLQTTTVQWIYVNKRHPNIFEDYDIYEDLTFNEVDKIDAQVFYPDGSKFTISKPQCESGSIRRNGELSSNSSYYTVTIPKYKAGTLIRLETQRQIHRPEFTGAILVRDYFPVLKKSITVSYPADSSINLGVENHEKLNLKQTQWEKEGRSFFQVESEKIAKIDTDLRVDIPGDWYAALHTSFPPKGNRSYTWQEIGDHYLELIEDSLISGQKIEEIAQNFTNKDDPKKVISQSFDYIKNNIRYEADEKGIYAIKPRKATKIINQGYGDCKEVSTLLKMLLAQHNIESHLALLKTSGFQVKEKYPSLDNFNHAILFSTDNDSNLLFYDGTVSRGHALNSYYPSIGRKALLIVPEKSRLTTISARENYENLIETNSEIIKEPTNNQWLLKGTITLHGNSSFRFFNMIKGSQTQEKGSLINQYLQRYFEITPIKTNIEEMDSDYAQISYTASLKNSFIRMGNGGFKLIAPSLYGGKSGSKEAVGKVALKTIEQKDTWTLPKNISELQASDLTLPHSQVSFNANGNRVTRKYRQQQQNISASTYKQWQKKYNETMKSIAWY